MPKSKQEYRQEFGLMIHIQEPESPLEVVHMDWVTALPPSGDKSYNGCLVIVDRYSKTPILLPCHKDDTALDTALLLRSRVIPHTGLFKNIISDRDFKVTSAILTNINRLFGTNLSFYTAYHPKTDGLAERKIQALEDRISRFCAYGLEFKDSDGFTHDWCTLIPALEFAYKTSVHSCTVPKKLEDSYVGPFIIVALHGTNAVQVELSGELENKHPTFPVRLIKTYQPAVKELFPLRNPTPLIIPPVEQNEDKMLKKFIKERRLRGKNQREYLVRYRNTVPEDEWLEESETLDSVKLLRRFRHERRPQA
ncbi:hypothetical protein O181_025528 [Austropuccinia psidii MF-1]|uniref:Integrase catalytic domain-containing protein n=1 Tax=Austropuccinia psidii MF-1 TaxID=1389203 RepID=A0A9Q3GZ71_9BASI|nr:hypothetical protein [Austropuccinia psidii MF-1]